MKSHYNQRVFMRLLKSTEKQVKELKQQTINYLLSKQK